MTTLGMVLLVLGALVAISEAHYPSHGIAGGIGVLAMAAGAVFALSGLGAGLALGLIAGVVLASTGAGAVALSVSRGVAVRGRAARTGPERLVGQIGTVRSWQDASGSVALAGALWQARRSHALEPEQAGDADELHAGDQVVVERLSGLTLSVRRAEDWELPE
jgi:membrane-bound ClpP family serine protease